MSCSISGVPRMMEIYALIRPRSGVNRLRRPNITTRPSGSEPSSVSAKMSSDVTKPCASRESIVDTVIEFPSVF